jgi:hypothetical protein
MFLSFNADALLQWPTVEGNHQKQENGRLAIKNHGPGRKVMSAQPTSIYIRLHEVDQ